LVYLLLLLFVGVLLTMMKLVGVKSISLNEFAIQPPFPSPIPSARQSLAAAEVNQPTHIISGQEECYISDSITGYVDFYDSALREKI
jgi:hypothetical protein